jgi:hypothetical protein
MSNTGNNFYSNKEPVKLIHEAAADADSDLKEKLFVAEKVMKSLFERNK